MPRPKKKRLPLSRATHGVACWWPDEKLWSALASAWGADLTPEIQSEIAHIVQSYFDDEPFSRNAARVEGAAEWLEGIEAAANELNSAALKLVGAYTGAGGGGAKVYAESILNEFLAEAGHPPLRNLVRHALDVAVAARNTMAEINADGHPSFDERGAWRTMVVRLWKLAQKHGWPSGTNMAKVDIDERPAPFVAFIAHLQANFPDGLARYDTSDASLTQAIAEATRPVRRVAAKE